MDVFVYGCDSKEESFFKQYAKEYKLSIGWSKQALRLDTLSQCIGCTCISVLSTPLPAEVIQALYKQGVRFISTRTIGYDHIDLEPCKQLGIQVANINYAPESVSDYTILLILMVLRKMKMILKNNEIQEYSFQNVEGRNLKNRVVGVIGTGAIGSTLIRHLSGFECKIIAYSNHAKEELKSVATYTDLDTLLKESDIITLHLPLNEENYHFLNEERIAMMKQGVILINTARGALLDSKALIQGIESGKIAGAALDVLENETGIYYRSQKGKVLTNHELAILNSYPNVIMTPHLAFLSEESIHDMVMNSMKSCRKFLKKEKDPYRIA